MTIQVMSLEQLQFVPKMVRLRVERNTGYGSVAGLEDEELTDPAELERQVFVAEWGPILVLPCRSVSGGIRPTIDEFGELDWGAFGTVDFQRIRPPFDKARYRLDKLREQLRNDLFMLDAVRDRVRPEARRRVRELALHTDMDVSSLDDWNEWRYASWLRRIQHLAQQLHVIRRFRRRRRQDWAVGGQR